MDVSESCHTGSKFVPSTVFDLEDLRFILPSNSRWSYLRFDNGQGIAGVQKLADANNQSRIPGGYFWRRGARAGLRCAGLRKFNFCAYTARSRETSNIIYGRIEAAFRVFLEYLRAGWQAAPPCNLRGGKGAMHYVLVATLADVRLPYHHRTAALCASHGSTPVVLRELIL